MSYNLALLFQQQSMPHGTLVSWPNLVESCLMRQLFSGSEEKGGERRMEAEILPYAITYVQSAYTELNLCQHVAFQFKHIMTNPNLSYTLSNHIALEM